MLRGCYGGDRDGIRPCLRSQHVRLGMIVMWGAIVGIYWIREETFPARVLVSPILCISEVVEAGYGLRATLGNYLR